MNSPGSAGEGGQAIRPAQLALVLLFVVVFAAKLGLAWRFPGFLTGDDLEIVETARLLFWMPPLYLLLTALGLRDRRIRAPILLMTSIVVLLSLSPNKTLRYLQAAIPFLALSAALGWERLASMPRRRWLAVGALVLAVPLGLERTFSLLKRKSQSAIAAARFISARAPRPQVVALEQMWAYGDRLYLGNDVEIRDIPPARPLSKAAVSTAIRGAGMIGLYSKDLTLEVRALLTESGFHGIGTFKRHASLQVEVFERSRLDLPQS